MSGPLRLALVGCGAVAEQYHAPALAQGEAAGWIRVAALVDPSPARRAALQARFPASAAVDSVEALPVGLDLAIVASPVRFHAPQSAALLARGCAVLCEKPLCRMLDETEALARTAESAGRPLLAGLFRRFFPATEQIRSLTAPGGALGRPLQFAVEEGGPFGWPAASPSFFTRAEAGGGVTMDIGSHQMDLLAWWFGEPVEMEYRDDAYGGVEANAAGRLVFAGGVEGTFQLSWDLPTANEYRIEFERGTVRWSTDRADRIAVTLAGADYALDATLAEPADARPLGLGVPGRGYLAAFTAQLRNLVQAARGEAPPRVPVDAGVANLRTLGRLYAARTPLLPGWFDDAERARATVLAGSAIPGGGKS